MKFTRFITGFVGVMLLAVWPLVSSAHVHMEKSSPEDGAHLTAAPTTVEVWFSGKIAAEWSTIEVTDTAGQRVDKGKVTNGGDPKHLNVELQPLPTGSYEVKLNVISGDGHRVKGSFSFTVE